MTNARLQETVHLRRRGVLALSSGLAALAVACVFGVAWYTDRSSHGERAFLLLPLVVLVPFAFAGILSGLVARYHWSRRRWVAITIGALGVTFLAALWVWHV